jgi:hypothetical protein
MRGGYGRSGSRGQWPGNGPFRDLPPWERPGWLYGRGSCWYMGYRPGFIGTPGYTTVPTPNVDELQALKNQKELLESQLRNLQENLSRIEKRLSEIQDE